MSEEKSLPTRRGSRRIDWVLWTAIAILWRDVKLGHATSYVLPVSTSRSSDLLLTQRRALLFFYKASALCQHFFESVPALAITLNHFISSQIRVVWKASRDNSNLKRLVSPVFRHTLPSFHLPISSINVYSN